MANLFFTSDTHFGHNNIISLCQRPYTSVEEMDEALIDNWNRVVTPSDIIYHLGDFCFKDLEYAQRIFNSLNGLKHFVRGNHDRPGYDQLGWRSVEHYQRIKSYHLHPCIILSHYPFASWDLMHRGSLHLHGHCHGNYPSSNQHYDVGVDSNNYTPISYEDLITKLKTLPPPQWVDHHVPLV